MGALILDLETSIQTYNKRKASPFCPDNYVVAAGYLHDDETVKCDYFADQYGFPRHSIPIRETTDVLVGFNIKFDLLYMWGKRELQDFFRRGGRIWCCQYAHYLLLGMQQRTHMVSMDSIVEEYGGSLKIDEVKAFWDRGIDTPEIPEDLLIEYLKGDLTNTDIIYREQMNLAKEIHPNFLQMLKNRMDGLLATTEMEYRGLTVDEEVGEQDRSKLQSEYEGLVSGLNRQLPNLPDEFTFNWKSNYHRSYILFGGIAKYKAWEPKLDSYGKPTYAQKTEREEVTLINHLGMALPYRYKTGKRMGEIKYKNTQVDDLTKPKGSIQDQLFLFKQKIKPKTEWQTKLIDGGSNPIYRTGADIIELLGKTSNIPFLQDLAKGQMIGKDLSTYYYVEDEDGNKKGMLTLIGADGRIHHKLNHTSTVTSRLSSSDPNMQNIPRGDKSLAKRMFISRFGTAGRIIEIDYSQLEVIIQGVLSKDGNLCRDLKEGIDFHIRRLSNATGKDYDYLKSLHLSGDKSISAQRTAIKSFTFARAYGAGVSSIAEQTGMSPDRIKELIESEEAMYPGLSEFDRSVEQAINKSATRLGNPINVDGVVVWPKVGEWYSPTGTRYVWRQKETPQFMKEQGTYIGFSPTERKNWPVQGLGGEIVQTMIGKVWRYFNHNNNFEDKAYLINTVHDCCILDCHIDKVDRVVKLVSSVLEKVPSVFNHYFDMEIDVPFPVSVEVGLNWYDMEHYER